MSTQENLSHEELLGGLAFWAGRILFAYDTTLREELLDAYKKTIEACDTLVSLIVASQKSMLH